MGFRVSQKALRRQALNGALDRIMFKFPQDVVYEDLLLGNSTIAQSPDKLTHAKGGEKE